MYDKRLAAASGRTDNRIRDLLVCVAFVVVASRARMENQLWHNFAHTPASAASLKRGCALQSMVHIISIREDITPHMCT